MTESEELEARPPGGLSPPLCRGTERDLGWVGQLPGSKTEPGGVVMSSSGPRTMASHSAPPINRPCPVRLSNCDSDCQLPAPSRPSKNGGTRTHHFTGCIGTRNTDLGLQGALGLMGHGLWFYSLLYLFKKKRVRVRKSLACGPLQ